ncbi:MAG: CDP-glucose 4,6-dehydratase [Bryobacteraceae bacterium]|nr:CDP-glucose 4,6-dehydratase [Bryobacteraceae bacterium]
MVNFDPTREFWAGRRVFLTGHTGFKGSWLLVWLNRLGAEVCGYSLEPPSDPSMFATLGLQELCQDVRGDINDAPALHAAMRGFDPEVVLHLAALPLVRQSYRDPVSAFQTNAIGTANVILGCRECPSARAAVMITTDKVYENREWCWPYRETDALGGYDPYSASKACAELITDSLRRSFFHPSRHAEHHLAIASARAGNVIGGGDWGGDRIVPDAVRAFSSGKVLDVRRPDAVRPWQHVIDPLGGYLTLARALYEGGPQFATAWNLGPPADHVHTVRKLVDALAAAWGPEAAWSAGQADPNLHEAGHLTLDPAMANQRLRWSTRVSFEEGIRMTAAWYRAFYSGSNSSTLRQLTSEQIGAVCG